MNIETHAQANGAMMDFWYMVRDGLPDRVKNPLHDAITSVIAPESVSHFTEIVFANREEFTAPEQAAAADVAEFAAFYGFYGLGEAMRGNKIVAVLRGDPLPEDQVPERAEQFTFPEPEEPEEPEVPGEGEGE